MARVDVVMPKMGESVMEGTVLEWIKAVGDEVEQDETLLEISTDKVDSEVPSPEAGRLAEILVQEGDTVEVGTPIAVIETDVDASIDGGGADGGGGAADNEPEADGAAEDESVAEAVGAPSGGSASDDQAQAVEDAPEVPAQNTAESAAEPGDGGTRVEVVMPKMGESVMEGTVLEWIKAVGDEVEQDETLLEISTDKVDSEVPSPEEGTLLEILVEEGETVDVGTPIAVIGVGAPVEGAAPSPSEEDGESEATPTEMPAQASSETSSGMTEERARANGSAQLVSGDGASAEPGAPIPRRDDEGRFYSPLVRSIAETEGLSLGELQRIGGSGVEGRITKQDVMDYLETRGSQTRAQGQSSPEPQKTEPQKTEPQKTEPRREAEARPPAARQTSPPKPAAPPARTAEQPAESDDRVEVVQMDRMRQLIADHMRRSKDTSAHVTSFTEVDVTGLVKHREAHKKTFKEREGRKLTYTPYFLYAAIEPLRKHPMLNASVEDRRILIKKDFHVGIAVAIGQKGLLVPVVRNAGQKNLTGLVHTMADLAERARNKKLQPDELQGGTFTLTNVGSLGSLMGTPIINQPQVAIVSPGAIVKRPVVIEHPELGDTIAIRQMMYVSLSYDHRIIDGAMAASFLGAYRDSLESITPESTLF